jgi:hypothetical protein
MDKSIVNINNDINISEELLEKVILQNDLGGLTPLEKVQHVKNVCLSLGLNPITKPIQIHKFQGKEVMYMSKDGAEQLRKIHNVSIIKLETDILRNDLYVVKVYAQLTNGRQDCSTAAVGILGLKGDAIGNAMKKCETQAKRRVTLSICGLGMLSEEELENLPKDNVILTKQIKKEIENNKTDDKIDFDIDEALINISQCSSQDELKRLVSSYSVFKSGLSKVDINKIVEAKNKKQEDLKPKELPNAVSEFLREYDSVDIETGEIK